MPLLWLNNIKIGYYYVFSIPAKLSQQGYFIIRNNYVSGKPFIELKVHEYHYYTGSVKESFTYTKDDYSTKKLDNELVISIPHKVRNSDTNHLGIMIKAKSHVKYLTVLLVLGDNIFYLKRNNLMNINKLLSGVPYYFYIPTSGNKNINIDITTSYIRPFEYLNIYEYDTKDSTKYTLNTTKSIITKKNNFSISYIVSQSSTQYLSIEMIPDYNFDYINIIFVYAPLSSINIANSGISYINNGNGNENNEEIIMKKF